MKKVVMVILCLLSINKMQGQVNLVPNPSFEIYDTCPNAPSQIYHAVPWFQPTQGTSDLLNTCSNIYTCVPHNFWGYQNARTGVGYAGIFACFIYPDSLYYNYREYIEVKLDSTLISGQNYFVSFFVSLGDSERYATDAIGMYFSIDSVKNETGWILILTPQIQNTAGNFLTNKTGWMKISGKYTAAGGENFITIGNFKSYTNTDTVHAIGGSNNIGQSDWSGGYYYIDDICVSIDSVLCNTNDGIETTNLVKLFSVFPSPNNGTFTLQYNLSAAGSLRITDVLGREVYVYSLLNRSGQEIITLPLSQGIYFWQVLQEHSVSAKGKLVILK